MTQLTSDKPAEEVSVGGFAPIILAIPYTLMVTVGAFLIGFVIAIPLMFMRGSKFVPFRSRLMVLKKSTILADLWQTERELMKQL